MSVLIRFIGDAGPFIDGVRQVNKGLKDVSREALKQSAELAKWGAAAASAAAVAGLALIKNSADSAKEIKNLSQVANASVTVFQQMAFGAKSVGIEQEKFADILKDVNDRIGDFVQTGGGPMVDFFENIAPKVGVTIDQFRKLSGPDALQLFYTSLEKANLSQADMTFYMEAMASDATALIPLLKDNGAEFSNLSNKANELGAVLSEFDIQRLQDMDKRFGVIASQAETAKNQVALGLLPVTEKLADAFIKAGDQAGGFEKITLNAVKSIAVGLDFVIDAITALKVVWKGVELVATSLGAAALTSFDLIASGVATLVDFGIDKINMLISAINSITGSDIQIINPLSQSEFITGLAEMADTARGTVVDITSQLHDLAMQHLPSDEVQKFVADAIAATEQMREAFKADEGEVSTSGETDGGSGLTEAQRKEQEERLEAIRKGLMDERELTLEKYAADIEDLKLFLENKLIAQDEYNQLNQEATLAAEAELTAIEEKAAQARTRLAEAEAAARKNAQKQMWSDLSSLMNSGSKKAFEIGKGAAIASATINGIESAIAAWDAGMSTGGPWAPAVAAAYTAASLAKTGAMISSLRSQSYGGGGGASAAASSVGNNSTSLPGPAGAGGSQPARTAANISIAGGDMFTRDSVIALAGVMSELAADGVQVFNVQ